MARLIVSYGFRGATRRAGAAEREHAPADRSSLRHPWTALPACLLGDTVRRRFSRRDLSPDLRQSPPDLRQVTSRSETPSYPFRPRRLLCLQEEESLFASRPLVSRTAPLAFPTAGCIVLSRVPTLASQLIVQRR